MSGTHGTNGHEGVNHRERKPKICGQVPLSVANFKDVHAQGETSGALQEALSAAATSLALRTAHGGLSTTMTDLSGCDRNHMAHTA